MQLSYDTLPGGEVAADCFLPGPPALIAVPADTTREARVLLLRTWDQVVAALRTDTLRNLRAVRDSHGLAGVTLQHDAGLLRRDAGVNVRPLLNRIWEPKAAETLRETLNQLAWVAAGMARRGRRVDLADTFVKPYVLGVSMVTAGLTIDEACALGLLSDMTTGALLEKPEDHAMAAQAWDSLYALTGGLVGNGRLREDRSLLGQSVAALDQDRLPEDEVRDTVTTIYNGLPTLRPVLIRALEVILARPAVLDTCHVHPELVPVVVEEALRYAAHFTFGLPGMVTQEAVLGDRRVRAGTVVLPVIHAAHRDETHISRPGEFDATRQRRGNLAWGAGQHTCLGRHLGKIALEEAVTVIAACRPRLARPADQLEYFPGTMPVPAELPVKW